MGDRMKKSFQSFGKQLRKASRKFDGTVVNAVSNLTDITKDVVALNDSNCGCGAPLEPPIMVEVPDFQDSVNQGMESSANPHSPLVSIFAENADGAPGLYGSAQGPDSLLRAGSAVPGGKKDWWKDQEYYLCVSVKEARNLAMTDFESRSSSTRVQVIMWQCPTKDTKGSKLEGVTHICVRNRHPMWHERFFFPMSGMDKGDTKLQLTVMSRVLGRDSFAGQVQMTLSYLIERVQRPMEPYSRWYQLARKRSNDRVSGDLHFSVTVVPRQMYELVKTSSTGLSNPATLHQRFSPYCLKVSLHGLQELRSTSDSLDPGSLSMDVRVGTSSIKIDLDAKDVVTASSDGVNVLSFQMEQTVYLILEESFSKSQKRNKHRLKKPDVGDLKLYVMKKNRVLCKTSVPLWDVPIERSLDYQETSMLASLNTPMLDLGAGPKVDGCEGSLLESSFVPFAVSSAGVGSSEGQSSATDTSRTPSGGRRASSSGLMQMTESILEVDEQEDEVEEERQATNPSSLSSLDTDNSPVKLQLQLQPLLQQKQQEQQQKQHQQEQQQEQEQQLELEQAASAGALASASPICSLKKKVSAFLASNSDVGFASSDHTQTGQSSVDRESAHTHVRRVSAPSLEASPATVSLNNRIPSEHHTSVDAVLDADSSLEATQGNRGALSTPLNDLLLPSVDEADEHGGSHVSSELLVVEMGASPSRISVDGSSMRNSVDGAALKTQTSVETPIGLRKSTWQKKCPICTALMASRSKRTTNSTTAPSPTAKSAPVSTLVTASEPTPRSLNLLENTATLGMPDMDIVLPHQNAPVGEMGRRYKRLMDVSYSEDLVSVPMLDFSLMLIPNKDAPQVQVQESTSLARLSSCSDFNLGESKVDGSALESSVDTSKLIPIPWPEPLELPCIDIDLDATPQAVFDYLNSPESSFRARMMEKEKLREPVHGPWAPAPEAGPTARRRTVSYIRPLNVSVPMAPKSTKVTEQQTVLVDEPGGYIMEVRVTNDAIKGDCYFVLIQFVAVWDPAINKTRMRITFKFEVLPGKGLGLLRGPIEGGAKQSTKDGNADWAQSLAAHLSSIAASRIAAASSGSSRTSVTAPGAPSRSIPPFQADAAGVAVVHLPAPSVAKPVFGVFTHFEAVVLLLMAALVQAVYIHGMAMQGVASSLDRLTIAIASGLHLQDKGAATEAVSLAMGVINSTWGGSFEEGCGGGGAAAASASAPAAASDFTEEWLSVIN